MSYSLTTYPGKSASAAIQTKYNLTGYTFTLQLDDNSSFINPITNKGKAVIGQNPTSISLSFTAVEVDQLKDKYFKIIGARPGGKTYDLATGSLEYVIPHSNNTVLDTSGKVSEILLPDRLAETAIVDAAKTAVAPDINVVKQQITTVANTIPTSVDIQNIAKAKVKTDIEDVLPTRLSNIELQKGFTPKWQPNTVYAQNDIVISPTGQLSVANSSFTSGATFNPANWTATSAPVPTTDSAKESYVPSRLNDVALKAAFGSGPTFVESFRASTSSDLAMWNAAIAAATNNGTTAGTVIAGRGATYTFTDGVPVRLPAGLPAPGLRIDLNGCTIKLTKTCWRAFDFFWTADGLTFSHIEIFGGVIDAGNVTGATIFPATTVTAATTLIQGQWTTIPLASTTGFPTLAQEPGGTTCVVYFPATNTGTAQGVAMAAKPGATAGTIQVRNDGTTVTVAVGDGVQGAARDHVLWGNQYLALSYPLTNMSFENLYAHDIRIINVPTMTTPSLYAPKADGRAGVSLRLRPSKTNPPASTLTMTRIRHDRVRIFGGEYGFALAGDPGTFIDGFGFDTCSHDTGLVPTTNFVAGNIQVGDRAWVGRGWTRNFHGRGSGDVGIEIDQPWSYDDSASVIEETFGQAFYSTCFTSPAATPAGPPATTLTAAATAAAASVTIAALPAGVASCGWAVIDSELLYYRANAAGTTLTVYRGLNGTTAAAHTSGTAVTFHEHEKTSITYRGSKAIRRAVTATTSSVGRGFSQQTNSGLPMPRLIGRGCIYQRSGPDLITEGEALWSSGVALVDMDLTAVIAGINYTSATAQSASAVALAGILSASASGMGGIAPSYAKVTFDLSVSGVGGAGSKWSSMFIDRGYWDLDLTLKERIYLAGASGNSTVGIDLRNNPSSLVQGRVRIDDRSDKGDGAHVGLYVPSTVYTTVRWLEVEYQGLLVDYSSGGTAGNYQPWYVDASNAETVQIRRAVHSLTNNYPQNPRKRRVITAATTLNSQDEYVALQVTAPVTVTLPLGTSTAPGAINPAAGQPITIKDESGNLATNNVTIACQGTDTIDGATTLVLNANRQAVRLMPTGSGWVII